MSGYLSAEGIVNFGLYLHESCPEASEQVVARARNAFLRRYDGYGHHPNYILAVATDEELLRLRNAGKKCQDIYQTARSRLLGVIKVDGEMEMKEALYSVCTDAYERLHVDILALKLFNHQMTSLAAFDMIGASYLVDKNYELGVVENCIANRAYSAVVRDRYKDIEDPVTVLVQLPGGHWLTYVGMGKEKINQLTNKLHDEGYLCAVGGRMKTLPVRVIQTRRIKEDE